MRNRGGGGETQKLGLKTAKKTSHLGLFSARMKARLPTSSETATGYRALSQLFDIVKSVSGFRLGRKPARASRKRAGMMTGSRRGRRIATISGTMSELNCSWMQDMQESVMERGDRWENANSNQVSNVSDDRFRARKKHSRLCDGTIEHIAIHMSHNTMQYDTTWPNDAM